MARPLIDREQLAKDLAEAQQESLEETRSRLREELDAEAARGRVEGAETLTGAVTPIDET